jgi:hypothetical protein
LLAACGSNQMAYYSDDARAHTLSVVREQSYLGGPWQTTLVVAATPRCQKRHALDSLVADSIRVDVYRPEPGVYILSAGKRWYVTELQTCAFQAYKVAPPQPGEAVGRFEVRKDVLEFIADKSSKASPRSAS